MPAVSIPQGTSELIESTAFSQGAGRWKPMLHAWILQNPTEWRPCSPFFGSVYSRFPHTGTCSRPRIGDQRRRTKSEANWNIVIADF